jgi:hypothetical protein
MTTLRPADVCCQLLAALDASEGRRKRRKRDTTPDAIGMSVKRDLLAQAVEEDPAPEAFENWLLQKCLAAGLCNGPVHAMALDLLREWRLALASPSFQIWLSRGAQSDDAAAAEAK